MSIYYLTVLFHHVLMLEKQVANGYVKINAMLVCLYLQ